MKYQNETIKRISQKIYDISAWLLIVVLSGIFVWFIVSSIIFQVRHPWATKMECLIYTPEAFMLEKVPYDEMRK